MDIEVKRTEPDFLKKDSVRAENFIDNPIHYVTKSAVIAVTDDAKNIHDDYMKYNYSNGTLFLRFKRKTKQNKINN